jgi:hypothetical protein
MYTEAEGSYLAMGESTTHIVDFANRLFRDLDSLDARIVRHANTGLGTIAELHGLFGRFGVTDKQVGTAGHAFGCDIAKAQDAFATESARHLH